MFIKIRGRAPFVICFVWVLLSAMVNLRPAQASEKNCANQIADRQQEEENRIDKQKALSLAKAAGEFDRRTKGYKAEFNSIYFIHSFDPVTCDYRSLDSVNVVHTLSGKDEQVKNAIMHLDGKLERVTGSTEQPARVMGSVTARATNWSGYTAAIANSTATAYRPLNYITANWTVPKVSSPDTGDSACIIWCDISVWVSLQADAGGAGLMAQAGAVSYRTCSWSLDADLGFDPANGDFGSIEFVCSSKHGFVYDFLPNAAVECGDVGTVSTGHSITAYVLKQVGQGGSPTSNYKVSIADNTTGKSCSATYTYSMANAYFASVVAETTKNAKTGAESTLPKFSDITISGALLGYYEYDGATSYQKYYLNRIINSLSPNGQADYFKYLMYGNGSIQNIMLGNVTSSGTFVQQYLTSEK